ncbi:DNA polymerase III subunit delta' [Salimicrobium halophilum]|uniref:DNA polymerase III, delta prime subunit n=1 Tax=Salimicrobium halophilum TaxID=86666 RepID=A0A1G8W100_9BACI|nr:DNA polymerase III subunit delta' [Salimicrobium halophilum]SDJ72064.1 DNA polymerase III, delta prime subunit [Salimicrobium halophilum]
MERWGQLKETQPLAAQMLMNSYKRDRMAHAYLFYGHRGTGKREAARLLAKTLFCPNVIDTEPCQECRECRRIDSGNHPDLHWVKPDGASIKKEQILTLQKEFTYTGLESDRKVYVIEAADLMTVNASNRLLKFLEEPSRETTAILLTENSEAIIQTIRSRCQQLAFQPLNQEKMKHFLMEQGISTSNASILSALTNNGEEALEMLEGDWFANARKLVIQLTEVLQSKPNEALLFVNHQWMPHFSDRDTLQRGLDVLMLWFKDMLHEHLGREEAVVFIQEKEKRERAMMRFSRTQVTACMARIMEAKRHIHQNVHPTLVMEQLTLQLQRC